MNLMREFMESQSIRGESIDYCFRLTNKLIL